MVLQVQIRLFHPEGEVTDKEDGRQAEERQQLIGGLFGEETVHAGKCQAVEKPHENGKRVDAQTDQTEDGLDKMRVQPVLIAEVHQEFFAEEDLNDRKKYRVETGPEDRDVSNVLGAEDIEEENADEKEPGQAREKNAQQPARLLPEPAPGGRRGGQGEDDGGGERDRAAGNRHQWANDRRVVSEAGGTEKNEKQRRQQPGGRRRKSFDDASPSRSSLESPYAQVGSPETERKEQHAGHIQKAFERLRTPPLPVDRDLPLDLLQVHHGWRQRGEEEECDGEHPESGDQGEKNDHPFLPLPPGGGRFRPAVGRDHGALLFQSRTADKTCREIDGFMELPL